MDIDNSWGPDVEMFPEEAQILHKTLEEFVEYLMFLIKKHRERFPSRHKPSITQLESILR